jgi:hypothetical protein
MVDLILKTNKITVACVLFFSKSKSQLLFQKIKRIFYVNYIKKEENINRMLFF